MHSTLYIVYNSLKENFKIRYCIISEETERKKKLSFVKMFGKIMHLYYLIFIYLGKICKKKEKYIYQEITLYKIFINL